MSKNREILKQISILVEELQAEPEPPNVPLDGQDAYPYRGKYDVITLLYELHRVKNEAFRKEIFEDTAWHLLLEVFRLDFEGRHVHVSALCAASKRSQTTALRFLAHLEAAGLITREPDHLDRRRVYVILTDQARQAMRQISLCLDDNGIHLASARVS